VHLSLDQIPMDETKAIKMAVNEKRLKYMPVLISNSLPIQPLLLSLLKKKTSKTPTTTPIKAPNEILMKVPEIKFVISQLVRDLLLCNIIPSMRE